MKLSTETLRQYARIGAELELESLNRKREAIYAMFPDLRPVVVPMDEDTPPPSEPARLERRKRRKLTMAERKAISRRMVAYHANKRKTAA